MDGTEKESTKSEVQKVLEENPEIIENVLLKKPEILRKVIEENPDVLYPIIQRMNLATKEDIKVIQEELKLIVDMINRRFEDINRRFEDINRRFEDMQKYVDKRFDTLLRIMIAFDVTLLGTILVLLLRSLGVF